MARNCIILLWVGIVAIFMCSGSHADVPQMINYQGKLTTTTGGCLNDTVSITFSIYPDTLGSPADWTETQTDVVVNEGVFSVLLGSVDSIPASVFDGSTKYLGVQVETDAEMRPLKPMVSVAYAYRAGIVGGGDVNCHDCDTVFVNAIGPDSVLAAQGSAFLGKVSGSSTDRLYGVTGSAENTSSGEAYGGYFTTSSGGTGRHYGLKADGYGASNADAYGIRGCAWNTSSGNAYGGSFWTSSSGTGDHYGVSAHGYSNSNGRTYGISANADNTSSGDTYGGYFSTSEEGTGEHYGLYANGRSNSNSSAYGTKGTAGNYSSGNAYGGYFEAYLGGTGTHYGVTGTAGNTSSGAAYGGYFTTSSEGTGMHYGLKAEGYGASNADAFGIRGYAENTSSGDAEGGSFSTSSSGTGDHIGVVANANSNSNGRSYGVKGYADNYSSGDCYGGSFSAPGEGTGVHYGVRASSYSTSSSSAYGTRCSAENWSSGNAYGGYFEVYEGVGTGTPYGVYGIETAGGGGAAVYAAGDFAGSGAKYAVVKTGKGHRLLSVIESPEIWFEDFGEGTLVNGKAHIELDPLFLETVTISVEHPMKVFVQLTSGDPMNVVVKKGLTGFDVVAENLVSMASFDWRIVAKRKGYETERMRETDVGYDDPTLYPELQVEIDKAYQEEKQQQQLEREKRKQEEEQRIEEQKKMDQERLRSEGMKNR